jgi:hypothetical protein
MKLARPANFQNFDASALEHPDANPTGPRAPSNVVGTGLSNSSGMYVIIISISNLHLLQVYTPNQIHRYLIQDAPRLVNVRC